MIRSEHESLRGVLTETGDTKIIIFGSLLYVRKDDDDVDRYSYGAVSISSSRSLNLIWKGARWI